MNSTTTTYSSLSHAQRISAFVVATQYMENYGDSKNPYWKAKGGSDCLVIGAPDAEAAAKAVEAVLVNDSYNQEWVIGTDTHATWEATLPEDAEYRAFLIECVRVVQYTP
jgi:hypothetical protein